MDLLGDWKRTHTCGELRREDAGSRVCLMGWVQRRRDHGGLIFVDLRDRDGIVQLVFNPDREAAVHDRAHALRSEFVIGVRGNVDVRPAGTVNPNLATGEVEVVIDELKILNESKTPPFPIEDEEDVQEHVRLRYRYLDLRRRTLQSNFVRRHNAAQVVRRYLTDHGFLEVETPFLTRSTPEGARDYLVPSRLTPGYFYALPQSPQLFKQLLMVSGLERYFQIVKCFRDEDLRADRQPEFTQIDIEMSFVDAIDVQECMEGMLHDLFKEVLNVEIETPFPRMTYHEAMNRYGTDRPDLRFGMELVDVTDLASRSQFQVFVSAVESGGIVKGVNVKGGGTLSRRELDGLADLAKEFGAGGLVWIRVEAQGCTSPVAKFFPEQDLREMTARMGGEPSDLLLLIGDQPAVVHEALGRLRLHLGKARGLIHENEHRFLWVVDFPLLEYDDEHQRFAAVHHPFTAPREEDLDKLSTAPLEVRARSYDVVLNGSEIGGGSIRNHRLDVQGAVFQVLGIGDEEARERFGFLMEALEFGAPPHGGIAFGFDRLVMFLCGTDSIRDVIAFPKTQRATCPLTGAPSEVDFQQLKELHLKVTS